MKPNKEMNIYQQNRTKCNKLLTKTKENKTKQKYLTENHLLSILKIWFSCSSPFSPTCCFWSVATSAAASNALNRYSSAHFAAAISCRRSSSGVRPSDRSGFQFPIPHIIAFHNYVFTLLKCWLCKYIPFNWYYVFKLCIFVTSLISYHYIIDILSRGKLFLICFFFP